ncbi:MAG TPA: hypothetical protein VFK86_17090 [Bauldia sp.]|nr:hypothetical protein [Bauldia sp.]
MPKTLTKPDDIRRWAEARAGAPMSMDMPDGSGDTRTLLNITFGQHALNADENEGPDRLTGFELTSWEDWLAELDRQGLAIRVRDEQPGTLDNEFEFVSRDGRGRTTNAAKKPAV